MLIDLVERGGVALGLGRDLQCIGIGLVDVRLGVLLGGGHLLEGVVDLVGRVGLLDRDALNLNARAVAIEDLLHRLRDLRLDVRALVTHRIVEAGPADHRAHRAFGDLANGVVGLGQLEQVEFGRADVPAHRISDVDQILVAGQHQILGGRGADIDHLNVLDVEFLHPVDRRRERPPDAGAEGRL